MNGKQNKEQQKTRHNRETTKDQLNANREDIKHTERDPEISPYYYQSKLIFLENNVNHFDNGIVNGNKVKISVMMSNKPNNAYVLLRKIAHNLQYATP